MRSPGPWRYDPETCFILDRNGEKVARLWLHWIGGVRGHYDTERTEADAEILLAGEIALRPKEE